MRSSTSPAFSISAGAQSFDAIHVFGAEAAAKAAKAARAKLFIQMSALGADPSHASAYAKTKAEGEVRARAAFPGAIVLRPSIVFGPEDDFFNRFAAMARFSPALPLIGGGTTKFQPVFVGDVAEALAQLIDAGLASGRTYEFGGPEVMSFRELLEFTLRTVGRKRLLVPLPWPVARHPGVDPRTPAQAASHHRPGGTAQAGQCRERGSNERGPHAARPRHRAARYRSIVPAYLYRYRKAGQFTAPAF